jgi:hypothetical protein
VKPADIHHQICEVYSENTMSDGMVRKWVRKFRESHDDVHDKPQSGRLSVVIDGHVLQGGLQKLVHCYDKCLNKGGNYVEK